MQLLELSKETLRVPGCHKYVSVCCVRHCSEMHAILLYTRVDHELRGRGSLGLWRRVCPDVIGLSDVPVHGKCVAFGSLIKFI